MVSRSDLTDSHATQPSLLHSRGIESSPESEFLNLVCGTSRSPWALVFVWLAILGGILTKDNLRKCKMVVNAWLVCS